MIPPAPGRVERAERELRDFARLQVRAGLLSPEAQYAEVSAAVAAELPHTDASVLARAWLAAARKELDAEAAGWPAVTDHDRLAAVFAECTEHDVPVLQGVEDHWVAKRFLDAADPKPRGVVWFTQPDVWHAIDEGMLEVNLWHGDTANAAPGDPLLTAVLSCFERHGLRAHFDEGRIEVAAHWQRR
ncbi:hypothetical protein DDE18_10900 [Nocardioides gansuensis]|uniref:DUF6891 domain-containing protein n=1 Tax=Nocardioides gansuensis TaxID=2138300 RepID=A0A2T8FAV6_9ACTN|nr:hypothetical protein [Nocardioides gansuensis]PVG82856.1 hypothetical protein DDE18_10900 [Nocardioides gansuensis]